MLPRSFRTRRAHSLSRLGRKSKPLLTVQQLRAPRGVMHTGGARPAGASVVRTSSRAAEMQKKVRAQRALLGDGSGGPGATAGDPAGCRSAMALGHGFPAGRDPGGLLSPVSSIGVKLDSLHHWNGTPGAPAGHPAAIEGAHVPNSAMIERRAEPSSMSFSPGTAEQAHELRPSGYYPPTTVAPGSRGNVERDLEPVRSNDGMSFADMLARNGGANPSRTQPPSRAAPLGRILPDFQLSTFEFPHAFSTHFVTHPPARPPTDPRPPDRASPSGDPAPEGTEHPGAKRKAAAIGDTESPHLHSPPYSSVIRRVDSRDDRMCTPSTAASSPMDAREHFGTQSGGTGGTHAGGGGGWSGDGTLGCGRNTAVHGAFSPLQEGPESILPCVVDAEHGLPHVLDETLARVLQQCAAGAMRAHVIDCRYPHEFDAGHVRGAVNVHEPAALQRYLCAVLAEDADRAQFLLTHHSSGVDGAHDDDTVRRSLMAHAQNSAFILYCDFSGERAPRMWRHVRNLDRRDHVMDYPSLSFPHMYVLRGGYASFASRVDLRGWCTGPHLRVDDPGAVELSRRCASGLRNCWRVAGMSKGIGDVRRVGEDAPPTGGLGGRGDEDGSGFGFGGTGGIGGGGTSRVRSRVFGRDDDAFDEEGEQPYGRIGGWRGRWEMRDEPTECFDDDMRE